MSPHRNHDERRAQIAEVAWAVIERVGIARADLRSIAREGGFTTGVLSHYFGGKDELVAHAFGLVVDRQTARVSAAEGDLPAALGELLPLDAVRRRECVVWLALTTAAIQDPALADELARRCAQTRRLVGAALVRAGVADGSGEDLADEVLSLIDGITVSALGQPDRYPPRRQEEMLRRSLARLGLLPG